MAAQNLNISESRKGPLAERFGTLYKNGRYSDVIFQFPNHDNVNLSAHCHVLATASPVFERMLYGPLRPIGDDPHIRIVDSEWPY